MRLHVAMPPWVDTSRPPTAAAAAACRCGPARHAVLLASAAGVQAVGLDSSPGMVAYAAQRAQAAGVGASVAVVCADMAAPAGFLAAMPGARRVDLAAAMLGTLAHCLDNDAALRCFHNLAE
jgi:SAM-dependent methyltransferase